MDFRSVYRHAEEHTTMYVVGLFVVLAALVIGQMFASGLLVLGLVITIGVLAVSVARPLWVLAILAVYLPFEPLILKFTPDDVYVFARYLSEGLIYVLVAVVIWRRLMQRQSYPSTPIDLPFGLFVVVTVASAIVNFVAPTIAILGIRQILRFILVLFIAVYLAPSRDYIRRLTMVLFAIVLFQSALGLAQAAIGAPLDQFLLPSDSRTFGDITLTSGETEFWDPGSRVFATLGRYDRLGTFLGFFLLIAAAMLYEEKLRKERKELWWLLVLGLPTLVLTYSRSAWFGFLLGFLFIGLWAKRDRRVLVACGISGVLIASYLAYSGLAVRYLTDVPQQSVAERFFEAFSYERWAGEYYGLGRLFWIVQTVVKVVPSAPVFGFGPGQYGGGAAAALGNSTVYDTLGLPFGVYGTDGYIDNNWFSLWGETGTLGLALYLMMYAALFTYAIRVWRRSKDDPFLSALALGYAAAMIAVALNAFLATMLEVRTLAFYLWLYGGFIVVLGKQKKIDVI